MKIDVERAEDAVLSGAKDVLGRQLVDYFIVELRTGTIAHRLLADAGYEGFLLDEGKRVVIPVTDVPDGFFGDYLFTRPGLRVAS